MLKKIFKYFLLLVLVLVIAYGIFVLIVRPSNNRDWVLDNQTLAYADITGDDMTIHNVRNNTYRNTFDFDVNYSDITYDLSKLNSVDFIVAPFHPPSAHTFMSFGFEDGKHVAISIEARREKDESYNIFKGLFRRFEMIYVIAEESDVIKLRTNYRDEGNVYVYPMKVSQAKAKSLFLDMIAEVNKLKDKPEFYNTITNNCTNALVRHVNDIADPESKIGFSWKYVLPAYAGRLVYDLGFIDDTGTFEEIQSKYAIKEKAVSCGDATDFSACIRE